MKVSIEGLNMIIGNNDNDKGLTFCTKKQSKSDVVGFILDWFDFNDFECNDFDLVCELITDFGGAINESTEVSVWFDA